MAITIIPLSENAYKDLFEFEQYNWDYFADTIGARPATYRDYDSFVLAQEEILQEQANGDIAFYLIYLEGKLVGRINLRNIKSGYASLGYRICQSSVGKGIATSALKEIVAVAVPLDIKRINAMVSETNAASEKVLLKNDFNYSHTENKAVCLNGKRINIKHFYKIIAL